MTLHPVRHRLVGRIAAQAAVPGGARLIMTSARKAGGWFTWATTGTTSKPVKITAAGDSGTGKAVYEDADFPRVLVKGVHCDGRAFVVQYVDSKIESAYVLTNTHQCTTDEGEKISWKTERRTFDRRSVAEVKDYLSTPE